QAGAVSPSDPTIVSRRRFVTTEHGRPPTAAVRNGHNGDGCSLRRRGAHGEPGGRGREGGRLRARREEVVLRLSRVLRHVHGWRGRIADQGLSHLRTSGDAPAGSVALDAWVR